MCQYIPLCNLNFSHFYKGIREKEMKCAGNYKKVQESQRAVAFPADKCYPLSAKKGAQGAP